MNIVKAYERVAELIKTTIVTGELTPGSRLESVEQLAEKYQVGRSTVREALMMLRTQGLIDIRQGGGTFVLDQPAQQWRVPRVSDAQELADWLEVRFILETEGSRLAALRRSNRQLQAMDEAFYDMTQSGTEEKLEQADTRFHLAIADASGNRLLYGALETLFASMGSAMRQSRGLWLLAEQSSSELLLEEHRLILQAIRQQNQDNVKQLMSAHLHKIGKFLKKVEW